MSSLEEMVKDDITRALQKTIDDVFKEEWYKHQLYKYKYNSDYYPKRKYGKYTIYNKEGMRVAWGLNEREMKNYMKLLKGEE